MVVSIGVPESRPEGEQGTGSWAEWAFICCQLDPDTGLEAECSGRCFPSDPGGCGSRPGPESHIVSIC